jgi:hypothetical protein
MMGVEKRRVARGGKISFSQGREINMVFGPKYRPLLFCTNSTQRFYDLFKYVIFQIVFDQLYQKGPSLLQATSYGGIRYRTTVQKMTLKKPRGATVCQTRRIR